jgi:three-Cys-motif partner protein
LIQQSANRKVEEQLFSEFVKPDAIEFLKGSATRALHHPFARYIFIEKSETRVAELEKLKALSTAGSRIAIRKGDANSKLESFVAATDWKKTRAVVFLDPYGMQVNWNTIAMLGETKAVDLWFLFPLGQAVMRLLQKRCEPPREWQQARSEGDRRLRAEIPDAAPRARRLQCLAARADPYPAGNY